MKPLESDRSELVFADGKPPMTAQQAATEAHRCLFCVDAPCVRACPTSIDIPGFIRKIATGNVRGSARTILESNVLGQSCARVCPVEVLCVGSCVYNHLGQPPIAIGKLQRFSTDAFGADQFFVAGPDTGRSVGIIGGGPAGLACAHRLRRFGHAVTLYERQERLGGLNVTGVAPYKMPAADGLVEVNAVLAIGGIEVQTGVSVPESLSWETLLGRHDAIFVAVGLGADSLLNAPGAEFPGVEGAVAFIERMKLGQVDLSGVQSAVVIGGGNTAMDAVRELRGLGVPQVTLLYRGTEAQMSGYVHEWAAARALGVQARFQVQPVAFQGDGRLAAVDLAPLDAERRPTGEGTLRFPAQLALLAIGQGKLGHLFHGLPGVQLDRGRVVADAEGRTGHPRVLVGGDCRNGGKEVVNAVAEGRDAAVALHHMLCARAEEVS